MIARAARGEKIVDTEFPVEDKFDALSPPAREAIRQRGVSAFVTVQEGCDKFCTFCVVPYTRGAEISRPVEKIVADVERLAAAGVREVTLIGQNVNAYHGDGRRRRVRPRSARLLRRLAEVPGIARLRYTTSHPHDMDDDLIAAHRDLPALMPYVHLPVQSGSDRILAAMNRKHTRARLSRRDRAPARRAQRSRLHLGFHCRLSPARPKRISATRLTLVEEVGFAGAYTFAYSPRPGTPAADMEDQVPDAEKSERLQRLQALITRHWHGIQRQFRGKNPRRASGKAGQAPWATGRQVPIFAGGTGHGAAVY